MENQVPIDVRRAFLQQVAPRYQQASASQKRTILDGFVCTTGYARKYAQWLPNHAEEVLQTTAASRHRYGPEVQHALVLAWKTLNQICSKRLIPFLPIIIESLEQYGHVQLSEEHRRQLLSISAATSDRLLSTYRQSRPRGASPTPKPKPSFATFNDGMLVVGKDIQPGTYRTRQASPGCYYARLKGFGGAVDDIIANNNEDQPAIVTIASTDKGFQSTNCGTWTAYLSAITTSKTSFGDGMYIVGTDITPGTYKSSEQSGCYYARLSGFGNTTDSIIANNNTDNAAIVTIAPGDKGFQSERCGTWTKV